MLTKKYSYQKEIESKIVKVMGLAYQVNCKTDYAVFVEFSGHTNQINVRINLDKDGGENVADTRAIYLNPFLSEDEKETEEKYNNINVRLNALIDNLEKLLPQPLKIEL